MCGICMILAHSEEYANTKIQDLGINYLLPSRGPDLLNTHTIKFPIKNEVIGLFKGCVLWLQGDTPQIQPISDSKQNTLLWNGDNFSLNRDREVSDTKEIFDYIVNKSEEEIIRFITSIEGPWSFIYYNSVSQRIYFGRDVLGRHSLLWSDPENIKVDFIITSVANRMSGLKEVPAIGIFVIDLHAYLFSPKPLTLYLYENIELGEYDAILIKNTKVINNKIKNSVISYLNKQLPCPKTLEQLKGFPNTFSVDHLAFMYSHFSKEIDMFCDIFKKAIQKRVLASPSKCKNCFNSLNSCMHSKFAVMFSGGLDSALIAYFLDSCLPKNESIDLLNVSFETKATSQINRRKKAYIAVDIQECNFMSPDRESGIKCWKQLCDICPGRTWNFIELNITAEELQKERSKTISDLIAPLSSVLDDSIGCALYFCGRGEGLHNQEFYRSTAKILFSGLGADEQCAGYSRHRCIFEREGWFGLLEEMELEMRRISYRNLGRDDRVLSHHGRVVRFPFLDEEVISCLNLLPIWKKTNLYLPRGIGEKLLLRVVASSVGLSMAAVLPKRAIQFGSKIAKLENKKEKGGDDCLRLESLICT